MAKTLFYRGCDLFEAITDLPEYYQTRTELGILQREMPGIVARHEPGELVEFGSTRAGR